MLKWLKAFGMALGIIAAIVGFIVLWTGILVYISTTAYVAFGIICSIAIATYGIHEML